MERTYYRDQVLETIARKVLCAYDTILFYGDPQPIPVEEIIESYGISLEYQYLRKNGRILGKTIFDDGFSSCRIAYTVAPAAPRCTEWVARTTGKTRCT